MFKIKSITRAFITMCVLFSIALLWTCANPVEDRINKDVTKKYPVLSIKRGEANIGNGAQYDFGTAAALQAIPLVFWIENIGSAEISVTDIRLDSNSDPAFVLDNPNTTPFSLGFVSPSNKVDITITFTPTAVSSFGATLLVTSTDPKNGNYSVNLIGAGVGGSAPTPGSLSVQGYTETSVTLQYTAATDPDGPSGLQYKVVQSDSDNITATQDAMDNGTTVYGWGTLSSPITVSGLTDDKDYYFNVIVQDPSPHYVAYSRVAQKTLRFKRIYWTEAGTTHCIKRALLNGTNVENVITSLVTPRDLVIDSAGTNIYFTDNGSGAKKIAKVNRVGTPVVNNLVTGLNNPIGIALDEANSKLYWSDASLDIINRCDISTGGSIETVITLTVGAWCAGICIDPTTHWIYWAEYGNSRIMKANLSAPDPNLTKKEVADSSSGSNIPDSPYAIDIDSANQIVYFTENISTNGKVKRIPASGGTDTIEVIDGTQMLPKGIALLNPGDTVFWTESKPTGGDVFSSNTIILSPNPIISSLINPEGITIY
jgi:hypothetical protein